MGIDLINEAWNEVGSSSEIVEMESKPMKLTNMLQADVSNQKTKEKIQLSGSSAGAPCSWQKVARPQRSVDLENKGLRPDELIKAPEFAMMSSSVFLRPNTFWIHPSAYLYVWVLLPAWPCLNTNPARRDFSFIFTRFYRVGCRITFLISYFRYLFRFIL